MYLAKSVWKGFGKKSSFIMGKFYSIYGSTIDKAVACHTVSQGFISGVTITDFIPALLLWIRSQW